MIDAVAPTGDPLVRAFSAYFANRGGFEEASLDQPAMALSEIVVNHGRSYAVLRNSHRTLAVYRIRTDGYLRRLRRWPEELELD